MWRRFKKTEHLIAAIICISWWILIAVYWISSGEPFHLLWLCDLTLLITGIGLLIKNPFLISSQIVGTLPIQLAWNIDFWLRLAAGTKIFGFTEYMFSPSHPNEVKLLSLFHIFLPVFLILAVLKLGYDKRGWILQAVITCLAYTLSFLTTNLAQDTNWVLGPFWREQKVIDAEIFLVIWIILTVLLYIIFNLVLMQILPKIKKSS